MVNYYNASTSLGFKKGDLTIFKKIRYAADGTLVPFEKLFVPPLSENLSARELDQQGYLLEDNSEQEILDVVREFLERSDAEPSELQIYANSIIPEDRRSYEAPGYFGNAILKQYFPGGNVVERRAVHDRSHADESAASVARGRTFGHLAKD